MAAAPKIDRSRIPVFGDVHVKVSADGGEGKVVLGGIFEKGDRTAKREMLKAHTSLRGNLREKIFFAHTRES